MKQSKLNQFLYNLDIDIKIFMYNIKLRMDIYLYTSSVQAKTFSIINQLNGYYKGERRFRRQGIINNMMRLQELFLVDEDIDYYKKMKSKAFYKYLVTNKNIIANGFDIDSKTVKNIDTIMNEFYISEEFHTEYELNKILKEK